MPTPPPSPAVLAARRLTSTYAQHRDAGPVTRLPGAETQDPPCPTPGKMRFESPALAQRHAGAIPPRTKGDRLEPYWCLCGCYHLTTRAQGTAPTPQAPDADQLIKVLVLPDEEFSTLVAAELHGRATAVQAGALRTPAALDRWQAALRDLEQEVRADQIRRTGPTNADLRHRTARFLGVIEQRQYEAGQLVAGLAVRRDTGASLSRSEWQAALRALVLSHTDELAQRIDHARSARRRSG